MDDIDDFLEQARRADFERHREFYAFVQSGDIGFYRGDSRIDTSLDDFSKYGSNLNSHIAQHARDGDEMNLTVRWSTGLEHHLADFSMMTSFAEHAMAMIFVSRKVGIDVMQARVHIDADMDVLARAYDQVKVTKLINGFGLVVADVTSWSPSLSCFEKDWNFALCSAISGFVGQGYEWPRTEEGFHHAILRNASLTVIGTQDQLQRYRERADALGDGFWQSGHGEALAETLSRFGA